MNQNFRNCNIISICNKCNHYPCYCNNYKTNNNISCTCHCCNKIEQKDNLITTSLEYNEYCNFTKFNQNCCKNYNCNKHNNCKKKTCNCNKNYKCNKPINKVRPCCNNNLNNNCSYNNNSCNNCDCNNCRRRNFGGLGFLFLLALFI